MSCNVMGVPACFSSDHVENMRQYSVKLLVDVRRFKFMMWLVWQGAYNWSPVDLSHLSIWWRVHKKHFERLALLALLRTPVTFVRYSRVATALGFVHHHDVKPVLDGHFCDIGVLLHLIGICKLNVSLSCSNDSGHSSLETTLRLAKMCFAKCQVASTPFQPSADEFHKLVKCQRWDIKLQRCSHTYD